MDLKGSEGQGMGKFQRMRRGEWEVLNTATGAQQLPMLKCTPSDSKNHPASGAGGEMWHLGTVGRHGACTSTRGATADLGQGGCSVPS